LKNEFLAVILVLLVVGSLGVGYFAGSQANVRTTTSTAFLSTTTTATATTTSTQTITTTLSQAPPAGISLQVAVNGTTIKEGEDLAITATLFNTLNQNNKVSTTYKWPFYGLMMFSQSWPPCGIFSPLELLVLKGNFSSAQLMAMSREYGSYACMEHTTYFYFIFAPNGDLVNVTGSYSVNGNVSTSGPIEASVRVTTNGYWDNTSGLSYPTTYVSSGNYDFLPAPHSFVQGVYTVAVADEWGQVDVIHLTVE
jgi:hypothetical protein